MNASLDATECIEACEDVNEITRSDHVLEKVLVINLQMVGEGVRSEVPELGEEEFSIYRC